MSLGSNYNDEARKAKTKWEAGKEILCHFLNTNKNVIGVDLKVQTFWKGKLMTKWYIEMFRRCSVLQFSTLWLSAEQIHEEDELTI
jgi:hypothetical protein